MKKTILGLGILLMLIAVTGCTESEGNTKKTALSKFIGNYEVTFSDEDEELNATKIKEKISMNKCASKRDKDCLIKGGNDNQLAIMEDEEGLYLSVPVSYLVSKKDSDEIDEDFYNARICFEWSDYEVFTQIMCPPKDSNLFEKEDIDTKFYFRLSKDTKENK